MTTCTPAQNKEQSKRIISPTVKLQHDVGCTNTSPGKSSAPFLQFGARFLSSKEINCTIIWGIVSSSRVGGVPGTRPGTLLQSVYDRTVSQSTYDTTDYECTCTMIVVYNNLYSTTDLYTTGLGQCEKVINFSGVFLPF